MCVFKRSFWAEDGVEGVRVAPCCGGMDNATALLRPSHLGNAALSGTARDACYQIAWLAEMSPELLMPEHSKAPA